MPILVVPILVALVDVPVCIRTFTRSKGWPTKTAAIPPTPPDKKLLMDDRKVDDDDDDDDEEEEEEEDVANNGKVDGDTGTGTDKAMVASVLLILGFFLGSFLGCFVATIVRYSYEYSYPYRYVLCTERSGSIILK